MSAPAPYSRDGASFVLRAALADLESAAHLPDGPLVLEALRDALELLEPLAREGHPDARAVFAVAQEELSRWRR